MFATKKAHSATHTAPSLDNKRNPLFIKPRLNDGKTGDKYEVQAEKVANKIIANGINHSNENTFFKPSFIQRLPENRMNEPNDFNELQEEPLVGSVSAFVQNMDSPEENLQAECTDCVEEEQQVQSKSNNQSEADTSIVNNPDLSNRSGGNMDTGNESELDNSFRVNLSNLRIHNNSDEVQLSNDLDVQASENTGAVTELDCSDGRNINDNGDHDLDKLVHQPDDRSPDIIAYDYVFGESGAYSDFYIGFFAGTFGVDTSDDNRLFNNFTGGSGSQINFSAGSDMAREIGGTTAFTNFAVAFEESVRNYYNTNNTLQGFDCQAELIRTRPNYMGGTDSLFSWAVMGGYQRLEAHIDLSAGQIDITYRVFDHYGAGVSDAWSYLPGLSAMYYLQHYVTGSSSTYVPFIWSVRINRLNTL